MVSNGRVSRTNRRSILSVVGAEVIRAMKNHGIDRQSVESISETVVRRLTEQLGGRQIYIPVDRRSALARRDNLIRSRYNGRNGHVLCRRYGISRTRLYQILKAPEPE